MYILAITSNRKNARRHIAAKSADIEHLRKLAANNINECYRVAIYTSTWKLIETIR